MNVKRYHVETNYFSPELLNVLQIPELRYQMIYNNTAKLCSKPASPVHIFNVLTIIVQSLSIKELNLFELQITHK